MLQVKNINVSVDNFKLKKISFNIEDKATHVIIGPTGSGKTILLETIIGFRKINNGEIIINGKDIKNTPIEKRDIAYVPQDLALFPHLSVKDNIYYSYKINKNKKYNKELPAKLIEATGIKHLLNRKIEFLSGGEKQRVALVRALTSESKFLILDEPFSAINETTKNELRFLLKKIQNEFNLTILSVTHDLDEAFFLADSISIISDGKLLQTDKKKELYYYPTSVEVAQFLGINNIFDATISNRTESETTVFCKDLNSNLLIVNSGRNLKSENNRVKFGIRKSEIMILRDDLLNPKQSNVFNGVIELIIEKVSFCEIVVVPINSEKSILIEIPTYAFNKLKLFVSKSIKFTLKAESIFLLKNTD